MSERQVKQVRQVKMRALFGTTLKIPASTLTKLKRGRLTQEGLIKSIVKYNKEFNEKYFFDPKKQLKIDFARSKSWFQAVNNYYSIATANMKSIDREEYEKMRVRKKVQQLPEEDRVELMAITNDEDLLFEDWHYDEYSGRLESPDGEYYIQINPSTTHDYNEDEIDYGEI